MCSGPCWRPIPVGGHAPQPLACRGPSPARCGVPDAVLSAMGPRRVIRSPSPFPPGTPVRCVGYCTPIRAWSERWGSWPEVAGRRSARVGVWPTVGSSRGRQKQIPITHSLRTSINRPLVDVVYPNSGAQEEYVYIGVNVNYVLNRIHVYLDSSVNGVHDTGARVLITDSGTNFSIDLPAQAAGGRS